MTKVITDAGFFRRFWGAIIAPSEVAVAIGYAAPWRIVRC